MMKELHIKNILSGLFTSTGCAVLWTLYGIVFRQRKRGFTLVWSAGLSGDYHFRALQDPVNAGPDIDDGGGIHTDANMYPSFRHTDANVCNSFRRADANACPFFS
ncbi:hypothetical protein HAZT_HAZT011340 [Hyalella azteca]|uniref:Uncharacterized protein n=1 Tax=Hyalella azteca TaxID=294128 RepID=A0A6A0GQL0_HYAAZ|nr:hypothetical protein HAZT_HAZT011340 [Hyalella azteca]